VSHVLASFGVDSWWSDGWPPKALELVPCCPKPKWWGVLSHHDALMPKTEMNRCPQSWWQSAALKTWHMSPKRIFSIFFKTESPNLFYNGIFTHPHRLFSIRSRKKSIWAKTLARCPVTGISRTWVLRGDFDYLPKPQIQKLLHHWKAYDL